MKQIEEPRCVFENYHPLIQLEYFQFENYQDLIVAVCKTFYFGLSPKLQYEIELEDVTQEGGLIYLAATRTYNPEKGKFSTHLTVYLRTRLKNLVRHAYRMCRNVNHKSNESDYNTEQWKVIMSHVGYYDIQFRRIEVLEILEQLTESSDDGELQYIAAQILAGNYQRGTSPEAARRLSAML